MPGEGLEVARGYRAALLEEEIGLLELLAAYRGEEVGQVALIAGLDDVVAPGGRLGGVAVPGRAVEAVEAHRLHALQDRARRGRRPCRPRRS